MKYEVCTNVFLHYTLNIHHTLYAPLSTLVLNTYRPPCLWTSIKYNQNTQYRVHSTQGIHIADTCFERDTIVGIMLNVSIYFGFISYIHLSLCAWCIIGNFFSSSSSYFLDLLLCYCSCKSEHSNYSI